ncbi:Uncharacterised protein [uncultured archaeon]|nr:Uncharacterised protein [uncultured archaeon]
MAAIPFNNKYGSYPQVILEHLLKRMKERKFLASMGVEAKVWTDTKSMVPDLAEAPQGWFKKFPSFTILGEGPYWKSVYTIYSQGKPRRGAVDLDVWTSNRKLATLIGTILDAYKAWMQ